MGTSSSDVVSSDRGISSTSSSEDEAEENEGEDERVRAVGLDEGLKRERLRPRDWKIDAREGLLGATATGGICGASRASGGWTKGRLVGRVDRGGGTGASACCSCSV